MTIWIISRGARPAGEKHAPLLRSDSYPGPGTRGMTRVKNIPALSSWSRDRHTVLPSRSSVYRGGSLHKTKGRGAGQILERWREESAQRSSFRGNHKTFPIFS